MKELSVVVVVADGLGDRPVPSLGMKTPLEVVDFSPIADILSKSSIGLWDPIQPGTRPGSDTAHLALFGINPLSNYPGRGPFEAIGAGATLRPGDVAFRGNFATVSEDLVVVDRRAGRKILEAKQLVEYLNKNIGEIDGARVEIYHATEHRVAVVFRGGNLSDAVSDTDPHVEGVRVPEVAPLTSSEPAARMARIVNVFTRRVHELLKEHPANVRRSESGLPPANIILLRGAGMMVKYPKLQERRELKLEKAVAISATALVKGVCALLGFETVTPEGATGGVDSDLMAKARAAVEYYRRGYDLIYVHVKGTDAASHDGNPEAKVAVIERVLKAVSYVVDRVDLGKTVVAFLGDHTTPVTIRDHTSDPVPVMLYAPGVMADGFTKLSERDARRGSLGRLRNAELFGVLMDYSSRVEKFGA
ncbi:MAG: 2,3-bisphosphoglycerate-independent phosphoglycerate mutase [Sulfolobales archaeon]|nr:2,3-bisphosphoglycerate-independent phosphoglycerate mutase [Sulfolobales archaeon]MCX8208301.1 2,3-bisphosphoglycerate-independent phosphoglycerate mutase [Sulfolobales archaeon]MDW8009999.1 2,3-bisphosphoglycerate-independent phosphoglycerate mutase [Sulfolobales archaeon]